MDTDLELLDRWCAGDRDAGSELFERYFVAIGQFFANKIKNDVEELVQATFLACTRRRDHFRRESTFRTYLFSIARYTLYDYLRKQQRHSDKFDPGVTSLQDFATTPRSRMARQEQHMLLLQALCTLPIEQQILLELHYWEKMSNAELAQVFDVAMPTIRTRLHRARALLRSRMASLITVKGGQEPSAENLDAWARALENQRPGLLEHTD